MLAEPVALERAKSLHSYLYRQGSGVGPGDFLTLTTEEGLELLEWLVGENTEEEDLELSVLEAKAASNPWPLLGKFTLLGLSLAPRGKLS